jgi:hypothetical protein
MQTYVPNCALSCVLLIVIPTVCMTATAPIPISFIFLVFRCSCDSCYRRCSRVLLLAHTLAMAKLDDEVEINVFADRLRDNQQCSRTEQGRKMS